MAGKNSVSKTLIWILMAMLIFGLGGFGITNLGGYRSTVATVGDIGISMDDYARALQREIRATEAAQRRPVTLAEARQMGLDRAVLSSLVTAASLDEETRRLGISIGDETLAREIAGIESFQGLDGSFDRDIYDRALRGAGLKEADYEANLRRETARTLLQSAVATGSVLPPAFVETILNFAAQKRNVTWTVLDRAALETGLPVPTGDEIQAYYDAHPELVTAPEQRQVTYVWLTPDMIVDTVEVDDAMLHEAYRNHAEKYNRPEHRLVERLVFPDQAAAGAARALITSSADFDAAVEARGLNLADVDLGDVSKADLGAAGPAVFAADAGDVVGPLDTDLGPALFRVNAILAAQTTTYDEALPELRDELTMDRAARVIEALIPQIDDELAAGATLEDLAQDTDLQLGTITWDSTTDDGIAGYNEFRDAVAAAATDDFPEARKLGDGGIFALRLDAVIPPTLRPLDEVRDIVTGAWRQEALTAALQQQAERQRDELAAGKSFADLGLTTEEAQDVTRTDPLGDGLDGAIDVLFGLAEPGDYGVVAADGIAAILRLDAIIPADLADPDLALTSAGLNAQVSTGFASDLFQALAQDFRDRTDISVDQAAINSVNASFR